MGLLSGDRGIKATLLARHPSCFERFVDAEAFLVAINATRALSCVVRDGNIMMMGAPRSVKTIGDYTDYLRKTIACSARACATVVLCFDDPSHVPPAKSLTQNRRDDASKRRAASKQQKSVADGPSPEGLEGDCTAQCAATPAVAPSAPLEFTADGLGAVPDCHELVDDRATRYRFFDELVKRALRDPHTFLPPNSTVVVEGVDTRGASRPMASERFPSVVCVANVSSRADRGEGAHASDGTYADPAHSAEPAQADVALDTATPPIPVDEFGQCPLTVNVGEADFKVCRLADACAEALGPDSVIVIDTVDTDILPIALLSDCRSRRLGERGDWSCASRGRVYVGIRERGKKAAQALWKQSGVESLVPNDVKAMAGWLIVDVDDLTRSLCADMHSGPSPMHDNDAFVRCALLCASWAMCGCDYVPDNINAADAVHDEALGVLCQLDRATSIAGMRFFTQGSSAFPSDDLVELLGQIASGASEALARGKSKDTLAHLPRSTALKALWSAAYWLDPCNWPAMLVDYGY